MGVNDAAEMLEVAKEECTRLERQVAELQERLAASQKLGLSAIFLADAIGEAGVAAEKLAYDRAVKAEALEEAAASIPERMRIDELGMHQIDYTADLPQMSRVMLNGVTRFAERLTDMAAEYRKAGE